MPVLTAVVTFGGLTVLLASVLVLANRRLRVAEDPRLESVIAMLPNVNCGACGKPGCRQFAEALVQGEAQPGGCTVSDDAQRGQIASFLGIAVGLVNRRVARLACAGGSNVARLQAHYVGSRSCRAAQQVAGGGKACHWGCLGFGDCAEACDFDALTMDEHGLPQVNTDRCTACGDCVDVCPRDLFSLQPIESRLWVACVNPEHGDQLLAVCEAACTACGRCAQDAEAGLVRMENHLPQIDYSQPQKRKPIERCPTGAIVWLDQEHGAQRGAASPAPLRRSPLHDMAT